MKIYFDADLTLQFLEDIQKEDNILNFNTINTIVSNPQNEIPPVVVFSVVSFSILFSIIKIIN